MKKALLLLVVFICGVGVWLYSQQQNRRIAADSTPHPVESAPSAESLLAQVSPLPAVPQRPQAVSSAAPLKAEPLATSGPPMPSADKAADLTTLSGKTYKQARIRRVEPDGITYIFAGGIAKIAFTDLPVAIRRAHGYDAADAAAFAAQDDAAQAQLAAGVAATNQAVYNQTAAATEAREGDKQKSADFDSAAATSPTWIGVVDEKADKGLIVRVNAYEGASVRGNNFPSSFLGGEDHEIYLRGYPGEATVGDSDQIRFRAVPSGNATVGGRHLHVYLFAPPIN